MKLGHLFSYRLQFEDWWFESRVLMHGRRSSFLPPLKESSLISEAYRVWRAWPHDERVRFTNLLYMHVRSFTYRWDWEQFTVRYMVFDGCYKMAVALRTFGLSRSTRRGSMRCSRGHACRPMRR